MRGSWLEGNTVLMCHINCALGVVDVCYNNGLTAAYCSNGLVPQIMKQ